MDMVFRQNLESEDKKSGVKKVRVNKSVSKKTMVKQKSGDKKMG